MDAARPLKVLSSEMDLAETRFNRKAFMRERGEEVFRKICPSPILLVPFKDYPTAVQDNAVT
jgi:hypothetical protein